MEKTAMIHHFKRDYKITFKLWHLVIVGIFIYLLLVNYTQKGLISNLENKKTELIRLNKISDKKIDSITKVVTKFDNLIKSKDTLIIKFENEKEKYRRSYSYYKNQYNEVLNDYNALSRADKLGTTKELLHE